jgi:hypothetical protein
MSWQYNGETIQSIEDVPEQYKEYDGIIYCLCVAGGRYQEYIGQKLIWRNKKRIIGSRELKTYPDKRKLRKYKSKKGGKKGEWIYYEESVEDNGFMGYYGSNDMLKEDIKNGAVVTRYILRFVKKASMLNYWENKHLFCESVLEQEGKYYNSHIAGKWYRSNTDFTD